MGFPEGKIHNKREELANADFDRGQQKQEHLELGTFWDVKIGGKRAQIWGLELGESWGQVAD